MPGHEGLALSHNAGKVRHRGPTAKPGGDVNTQAGSSAYALLTDGTTIEIRPARPDDFDAVRDMHAKMSPENLYLRFFGMSRSAAESEARRVCREPAPDHGALLAVLEGPGGRLRQLRGGRRRLPIGGGRHGGRR